MKHLIYISSLLIAGLSNFAFSQSDNPCGAPVLNPGASCSFTPANLPTSSTATTGVPAPGCANYQGSDVWYQVVVPASGTLTIDLNTASGGPTDMGMAWYSATCCSGPFTLIECDDDDSNNGLMPKIARTGMTAGSTVWVRIWEYGGNAFGNFQVCSFSPPPPTPCLGGQNNTCANADPFCAGAAGTTYCNSSGVPSMGSYSCLSSTPNPMWLYMELSTGGNMDILISQQNNAGNPIDVDFALYGPFTNVANACANISPGTPTVDCSFSASATETANIVNGQAGQIYMMLVTNYNGSAGSIQFTQSGGNAQSNCSLILPCTVSATMVRDTCNSGVGSVTAVPVAGQAPYTYSWTTLGNQTTATVTGVPAGVHSVTMTTADGCTTTANVTVTNFAPASTGSSTPVSCTGGSDGTATASMVPATGTITYLWDDANAQTTQTATGLPAGTYTCTITSSSGCVITKSVVVTEIPGLTATITNQQDVTCNSGSDGIITVVAAQGTVPYTYAWTGSASTSSTANDLPAGTHSVTVTDARGCQATQQATLAQPLPLSISFITPDTTICPEAAIDITVTGQGGSSQYIYTWTSNGVEVGNDQTITVDPDVSGTQYCVTLSEACGSPIAQECMIINFPEPIIPAISPDRPKDCKPATFTFANNSNNPAEIMSTVFTFGNGLDSLVSGADTVSSTYENAGKYQVDVIVTSIFGCIYTGSFPNIVEAIEIPTASFTMSANPATIFETTVRMQDNSSPEVTFWEWEAMDAVPFHSSTQNPTFHFPEGFVGQYPIQLIVTTPEGCKDTVTNILTIVSDIIFYAPNTFTPDGNEFNQTWVYHVDGIDVNDFQLYIFNRWGQQIWECHDPSVAWDGTYNGEIVKDGTYVWKASVKDIYSDNKKEFGGIINVLK